MSRKQRRQAAVLSNSPKSTGPVTPAGKLKSSMNATRHGLFAKTTVLAHEDQTEFELLSKAYFLRFQPVDDVERDLIEEMIAATWRQRRLQAVEVATLDAALSTPPDVTQLATVFEQKAKLLTTFERCRTSYARQYSRALNNLLKLRAAIPAVAALEFQNEPEPHPAPAAPVPFPAKEFQNEVRYPLPTDRQYRHQTG